MGSMSHNDQENVLFNLLVTLTIFIKYTLDERDRKLKEGLRTKQNV